MESPEERIGRIIAECSDLLNAGQAVDTDAIIREHPDLAGEIEAALDAIRKLDARASPDDAPPVLGDFRILRTIGRGGMGVVHEAWQVSMDRRVALKVLPAAVAADTRSFVRFLREARTAGRLDHPNIVPVHAMGIDRQTPYYAMEFVEGETLAEVLRRDADPDAEVDATPSRWLRIAEAFAGAAEGLQHAHARGVIHRDLKPSNLILDREGRLRVFDFGLALLEGQETLTAAGDLIGTPLYMSPEQARARKAAIDHRTDIYSLGATLYEMLARRPPFRGRDHQDTLSQIIHCEPIPIRRIEPRVARDLETIVLKCLRKLPADRYGTAEALAQDLRRFVRGDPIEARPPSVWAKTRRGAARHRGKILAGIAGLLVRHYAEERRALAESRYREQVLDAAMHLQMCEMTVRAGAGTRVEIDPQQLFTPGDFLRIARETGLDPLARAKQTLEGATRILPARPEAHYHLARALLLLGERDAAIEELERAARATGGFAPARSLLDDLRDHPVVADPRHAGEIGEGEPEPYLGASVELHLGRGRALLEAGELSQAIECFVAARTLWPRAEVPQLLLGKAYYLKDEKESAERTFLALHHEAAGRRDEVALWVAALYKYVRDYARGLEWAGRIDEESLQLRLQVDFHNLLSNFDEAIRIGREAVEKSPGDGRAHLFLAVALLERKETAGEGLEMAKRAAELNPTCAETKSLLATAYGCNGRVEEAEALFLETIAMAPDEPRAYDHLGLLLQRLGRLDEAEARFREAIRVIEGRRGGWQYHFLNPYAHLAEMLATRGRFDESVEFHRKAFAYDPRSPFGLLSIAAIERKRGKLPEARDALREAIASHPKDPRPRHQLAFIAWLQGKPEEATDLLRQAIEFDPTFHTAALDLGWALERQGKARDAFDAYVGALTRGASLDLCAEKLASLAWRADPDGKGFGEAWDRVATFVDAGDSSDAEKSTERLSLLAIALSHGETRADLDRGYALAAKALESTKRQDRDALAALADIEARRGNIEQAVRILEEACALPRPKRVHEEMLATLRRRLLPDLISFASIEAALAASPPSEDKAMLDRFAAKHGADDGLRAYLEARILQRAGDPAAAHEGFAALAKRKGITTRILTRMAECRRDMGDAEGAEARIRSFIEEKAPESKEVWEFWLALQLAALRRPPAQILEAWPAPKAGCGTLGAFLADCRWLLDRLAAGEPIRIRCGGLEARDAAGGVWAADRFYTAGSRRAPAAIDVAGTDDDALFRAARSFTREEPRPGYRIPLSPGRYRITFLFADVHLWDRFPRTFDIAIEGERALEGYDPLKAGFACADRQTFLRTVEDGLLDIAIWPRDEDAFVSAIEIAREE